MSELIIGIIKLQLDIDILYNLFFYIDRTQVLLYIRDKKHCETIFQVH